MRGCNEARPDRDWGEQGLQLQRASAESAKTRGASESEPVALKVQLGEVDTVIAKGRSFGMSGRFAFYFPLDTSHREAGKFP